MGLCLMGEPRSRAWQDYVWAVCRPLLRTPYEHLTIGRMPVTTVVLLAAVGHAVRAPPALGTALRSQPSLSRGYVVSSGALDVGQVAALAPPVGIIWLFGARPWPRRTRSWVVPRWPEC